MSGRNFVNSTLKGGVCVGLVLLLGAVSACSATPTASNDSQPQLESVKMVRYIVRTKASCDPSKVEGYLNNGADATSEVDYNSPLIWALSKGADQCALTLVSAGARNGIIVPLKWVGGTALGVASGANYCSAKVIRKLLKLGADPNRSWPGQSPLGSAALAKNVACAAALIAAGSDVNFDRNPRGITPLMWAQLPGFRNDDNDLQNRVRMTKLLLIHGAKLGMTTKLVENQLRQSGQTALFFAVALAKPIASCTACAGLLLKAGADPNRVDGAGRTPLLWALGPKHRTTLAAVRVLVESGARINLANPKTGETPLMVASAEGYGQIVHFLLNKGANRCVSDKHGRTATDYARMHHHLEIAALVACP